MKFVLASHNKGKLAEMQAVLADLGIEVVMPADLGIYVDVEETGETFAENAALKANAIMEASGLPAIADDSGLCVNWLGGAPGVYSARYGGLDDDAGPLPPAAAEPAGRHGPQRLFPHRYRLRLPQWRYADGGGRLPRSHCLLRLWATADSATIRCSWCRPCAGPSPS